MRLMTAGWVMKPTTRISPPQRGHTRGSTSYTRRIISAQRRLRAARSAPCGAVAPSGASPGEEGSAVVADGMASWLRDLHQDPGNELHRVDRFALGLLGLVVPSLARVDDLVRAGGEAQPGEAHRGAHHVADQRF
jgi:hypothetical protein